MDMPRGRPSLPLDQRKPRASGKTRPPTMEEAAEQQRLLTDLRAVVGEELWRRGETARKPSTWAQLAAVLGHSGPETVRRASLAPAAPGEPPTQARYVQPATLARWERQVRACVAGETTPPEEDF